LIKVFQWSSVHGHCSRGEGEPTNIPLCQVRTIAAARVAGVAAVNPSKVCRLGFGAADLENCWIQDIE